MEMEIISLNKIAFVLLHLFVIFSQICEAAIISDINVSDKQALVDIKSHLTTQNQDHDVFSSWNESMDFCLWRGVECAATDHSHRVIGVDLKGMNLYGEIAPSFGNLSFLHSLDLSLNSLTGLIPHELGRLWRLRHLNLSFNSLAGAIPANLSSCSNLITISLDHNSLRQHIPWEFGRLLKLKKLDINSNNITGIFPSSLGNLSSLEDLDLSFNYMEGRIPDTIGELKKLTSLILRSNQFSGVFPPAIYNLSSLEFLALTFNSFHGYLRRDMSLFLPNIQVLWLAGNNFTGHIPSSLSNISTLQQIELSMNRFIGNIPATLGNLQGLTYLNLHHNFFGNQSDDDLLFLYALANCSSLQVIDIDFNQLGGKLMASIGNLSSQLSWFNIYHNSISGSIPQEIGGLVGLTTLVLDNNHLTGSIPASIGTLPRLRRFYSVENHLQGEIPSSLGNLTQLLGIFLDGNSLEGNLPWTLSNLKLLQSASFSLNRLNGDIPPHLFSLPSLTIIFNLSHNSFTGSLPAEVGNLTSLTSLDVSYNHLWGDIPSNLGLCLSLNKLNLQSNFFGGSVPDLSQMKGLEYLDLSNNSLTGQIPDYLINFPSLLILNLSYNNLQGQVPVEGVFKNKTAIDVNGNNHLCGGIPQLNLNPCFVYTQRKSTRHVNIKLILVLVLVSTCLLLLLFLSMFVLYRRKNRPREKQSSKSSFEHAYPKISFNELHNATEGLASNYWIGAGSFGTVYRGVLREGEHIVAVKVLKLHMQAASKSFVAECRALGNIRHRNLVKILTVCSGVDYNGNDFKAILYPLMPNGSLDKWLHEDRNLTLLQRLNIAIDIASALEYLHCHCECPIIHCDLKPSNVLLDSDLTACVSDFGLARLLSSTSNQFTSLGLKGTFGYIAPEYGTGSPVSTTGDVYSYGILLLELFTGRRPVDETFLDNFNLHNFVKQALPVSDQVVEIIEQSAIHDQQHMKKETIIECFVPVLEIGITCSAENPQERINMMQVVHKLISIKGEVFPQQA